MPHPQQHDQARRRSVGSVGSSSAYSGHPEHPAVPGSTTYSSRQMLPPSSPQHYPPRGPAIQHGQQPSIPPPSSFASRELAAQNQAHRPGSSMSISSMLGSDTDRLPRESIPGPMYSRTSVTSIPAATAQPPPPPPSMSPPSGPARQPS
ncbi:hypothetical protein FQN49_004290, partial [Arthroderma sp. PD_2]